MVNRGVRCKVELGDQTSCRPRVMASSKSSRRGHYYRPCSYTTWNFTVASLLVLVLLYRLCMLPVDEKLEQVIQGKVAIVNSTSQQSLSVQLRLCGKPSKLLQPLPSKAIQNATLLILTLGGDIHQNPGPVRYPCGFCNKAVASNHRAMECDSCQQWFHIKCSGMSPKMYNIMQKLCEQNKECEWICPNCGLPNLSDSFFDDSISAHQNLYDSLNVTCSSSDDGNLSKDSSIDGNYDQRTTSRQNHKRPL